MQLRSKLCPPSTVVPPAQRTCCRVSYPKMHFKVLGQGLLTHHHCVAFTLWPAQLSSPSPHLPPLASKSVSSEVLEWSPPTHFLPPGFHIGSFCLKHSSPHRLARLITPHPLVQLPAYSTLLQGAFPGSSGWSRAPSRDSHRAWASPFTWCENVCLLL